jgi:hypothetical protein
MKSPHHPDYEPTINHDREEDRRVLRTAAWVVPLIFLCGIVLFVVLLVLGVGAGVPGALVRRVLESAGLN